MASYTYSDGELRFSDFTFPDCDDCFGYEVAFGFVPSPGCDRDDPAATLVHHRDRTIRTHHPTVSCLTRSRLDLNGPQRCLVLDAPC